MPPGGGIRRDFRKEKKGGLVSKRYLRNPIWSVIIYMEIRCKKKNQSKRKFYFKNEDFW